MKMIGFVINLCFIMETDNNKKEERRIFINDEPTKNVYTQVEKIREMISCAWRKKTFEEEAERNLSICVCVLLLMFYAVIWVLSFFSSSALLNTSGNGGGVLLEYTKEINFY